MDVVVELCTLLVLRPGGVRFERKQQDRLDAHLGALDDIQLRRKRVDLVVVRRVQGGCGRRRHPCSRRPRLGMGDLLLEHGGHEVGHGPHPFADLGPVRQPRRESNVDVVILVCSQEGLRAELGLADDRSRIERCVDLVSCAVEEAGVDKEDAVLRSSDRCFEVHRGSPLLIHHAELHCERGQPQQCLHTLEQFDGEQGFLGSVHLRLDNIDGAGAAVIESRGAVEIVHGAEGGEDRVEHPLTDLVSVTIEYRVCRHEVTDVPDEHEGSAVEGDRLPAHRCELAVGVHGAGESRTALADLLGQRALHQPKPVAVAESLVLGINGGDGVLQIHDGCQRSFENDVLDPCGVGRTDRVPAIHLDLDVQAVVLEENAPWLPGRARVADELVRLGQLNDLATHERHLQTLPADDIGDRPGVAPRRERHGVVEELPPSSDDGGPTRRIVVGTRFELALRRDRVGAVEGVVQGAPSGIRGIDGEAGVEQGHNELRSGLIGDLGVDSCRSDREVCGIGLEVADPGQECAVFFGVGLTGLSQVVGVDLRLELITPREQAPVVRCEVVDESTRASPEFVRSNASTRQQLGGDELVELADDAELVLLNAIRHSLDSLLHFHIVEYDVHRYRV